MKFASSGSPKPNSLFQSGSFSECIELCNSKLIANPQSREHLDYLARCYIKLEQYGKSIPPLTQLFELEPHNDLVAKQIAFNYQTLNKYDDAIRWYQECLKINPRSGVFHNNLATVYLTCGDTIRGLQLLERAIELDKTLVQPHMVLATLALTNGDFDRCIDCCLKALQIDQTVLNINLTLGKAYAMKSDFISSDRALRRELELNSQCIESYIFLVKNKMACENFIEAYNDLRQVIHKFPKHAYLYTLSGNILVKLDHLQEAENYYNTAIELNNTDHHAYISLGVLKFNMGDKRSAVISLEKSLNLSVTSNALTVLSQIYSEEGNPLKALDYAKKATSLNDSTAHSYCHLASLYLANDDLINSRIAVDKALQKNQYHVDCYLISARVFCNSQEYQSAIDCLCEGLSRLKSNHLLEGELVRIKFIKGEYDENNKDLNLDSQAEYFFDDCSGSSLVISFGSNGRFSHQEDSIPLFNFRSSLKPFHDFDKLYIRDLNRMYYMQGLVNCAPSISLLQDLIKEFVSAKQYKKVITIGASSGGFAALLYGNLIEADKIIAFNPQTVLSSEKDSLIEDTIYSVDRSVFLRNQNKDDLFYQKCLNIKNFVPFSADTEIHYSLFSQNEIDKKYAEYIEHPNCKLIGYESSTHLLALELREKNILDTILKSFLLSN